MDVVFSLHPDNAQHSFLSWTLYNVLQTFGPNALFFFFLNDPAPPEISTLPLHDPFPIFALAADIYSGDRMIGFAGQLSPARASVPGAVLVAELHADLLATQSAEKFRELERFPAITDRKSTRLNSSHLVISYAVFCLKKKK